MTPPAQAAAGLAVALAFALLCTRRTGAMAALCVAQALAVASAALLQGDAGAAAVELIVAAMLGWMARTALPRLWSEGIGARGSRAPNLPHQSPRPRGGEAVTLVAGVVLAALAASIPGIGLALAVVLLGLLPVACRPQLAHQALGIAAMQNGLVLAAVSASLADWRVALVALPLLPALAFGALWLGRDRARIARLLAPRPLARIEFALCGVALLFACTLPWQVGLGHLAAGQSVPHGTFWRLDAVAAHVILLLAALAAAASWAHRDTTPARGGRLAILAGTVLALLSTAPLLSWLGMVLAVIGAAAAALPVRAEAWRRLRLGCTGLGLALFGAVALHAAPPLLPLPLPLPLPLSLPALHAAPPLLPAIACLMVGYGALAILAPELALAAAVLILRAREASATGNLLLALGLAALLAAALSLAATRGRQRRTLSLAGLAQAGAAVFAFGLGTNGGDLAGLLQLSFLALTQCALLLAREDGLDRLAALAGLAGVPPFGLFPSLALILAATATRLPWLLLPLGAGLSTIAWAVLLHLPAERRLLPSPAWVPLALLLIAGFAMPDQLLAWFRLAAR